MMKALLYMVVTQHAQVPYEDPLIEWVRQGIPEVEIFDLDNHSDISMADYAIEFIRHADKIMVLIKCSEDLHKELRGMMKVLQHIVRQKEKTLVLLLQGKHPVIEKMGRALGEDRFFQTVEEEIIKEKLLTFFS